MGFFAMLVLLGLASTAFASFYFYKKARESERRQQLPPGYNDGFQPAGQLPGGGGASSGGHDLMNLKLNDIVSHFTNDYIIEGKLNYWEEGYTWITYMLVDGDKVRWLSVEEDDMLEVSMWEEVKDLHVTPPFPEYIEYEGERFRMVERGEARVNQQGKTGSKTGLNMEYYEYESPSEKYISVEKWGGDIEVSVGQDLRPSELDIFPGDDVGSSF